MPGTATRGPAYGEHMRRWPTWLLVGALAALGSVAVADALRGHESRTETKASPTAIRPPGPLIPPNEPAGSAMGGVLYFSDAERGCALRGLIMPDRVGARTPRLRSCRFSLAPTGRDALAGDAAWSPHGGLYAREVGGMVELGSPFSDEMLRFPGSAPAFQPDNTFTYVRKDELVEWTTDCPPGASLFTLTGDNPVARCRRVLLELSDLAAVLPAPVRITQLAWLDKKRLVVVVSAHSPAGDLQSVVVLDGKRLFGAPLRLVAGVVRIEASPRGGYFSTWVGGDFFGTWTRDIQPMILPPISGIRALTWSPDERWAAAATRRSVFVFRTNESEARVRRLPIVARDLVWR
jgi:hypothetical protein